MKRIQYSKYGGPELMQLEDFQLADPGHGEVTVKVKFAAINPIDWKVRNGQLKFVTGKAFPRALGSAAADGKLRLPVAKIVPLSEAIELVTALEQGHKLAGKALVVMD